MWGGCGTPCIIFLRKLAFDKKSNLWGSTENHFNIATNHNSNNTDTMSQNDPRAADTKRTQPTLLYLVTLYRMPKKAAK